MHLFGIEWKTEGEENSDMSINTILFDLDGTLLDTNELIQKSFEYTFEYFGYSFTKEEILQFNGPPLMKTFSEINPDLAEEMVKVYRKHNHENHTKYVKLFPNVRETLEVLKKNGKNLAIVTAKMRSGVELGLELTKIKDYFDAIVTIDDVKNPKPHPEPVLKAMSELDGEREESIMVGDNYHDIESGKNAGIKTVGVAWSLKGEDYLRQFQPTYMIDDMKELIPIVGV